MNKKWWYVGFFVLLFGVYFIYVFSQTDISQSNLPVINNNVQAFSFTNQNGKTISEKEVDGKVYVAEFFFTTCKGICPKMNANMRRVYDAFKTDSNFIIISHTCMPETDSVPLLKKYEQKMLNGKLETNTDGTYKIAYDTLTGDKQTPANPMWNFVTGDKTSLYNMARHSYLIDNNKPDTSQNIADQFIHTQLFALVDKQTRVRGIYDGLKEAEMQKLLKDIAGLLKEKHQNRELKSY
ncbi:SCO family protein [Ferruginibacter paludis]|uniref:SCO family protein n=1 Tax=Ferruginibacter paludis TaxID=1310417 RepID=UPI0025B4AE99|nr:SCO family protein [Ferruginibacter paludis]MDN3658222.1 SCO family protein [Ferruginibacter paludis]